MVQTEIKQIITYCTLCALSIVLYFKLIEKDPEKLDFLNRKLFTINDQPFSWWPITHVIFFAFLAFQFPDKAPFLVLIGIVWEVIECIAQKVVNNSSNIQTIRLSDDNIQYKQWWSGSSGDIIANIIGILLGSGLHYQLKLRS
jgi:hypothetical protein